jgi:membrane protein
VDDTSNGEATRSRRLSKEQVRRTAELAKHRYEGSSAERMWDRLNAMDFINQAMQFAAILLLAFLPFLLIITSLAGRDVVASLSRRMGLSAEAAHVMRGLFNSSSQTSNAVTVQGVIFALFGGIGTAATLQAIYERLYGLTSRGMKDFHRQLIWVGAVLGGSVLAGWAGREITKASLGPVLLGVSSFLLLFAFWFLTMWLLLSNRVPARQLRAPAVATALFWIGFGVYTKLTMSGAVIGNDRKYGAIGVVFALMSWLIGMGVVIILGAVVGIVWKERDLSFSAAFSRLVHPRRLRVGDTTAVQGTAPQAGTVPAGRDNTLGSA